MVAAARQAIYRYPRCVSAVVFVSHQHQLSLCAVGLPAERKTYSVVRFPLHQRERLHLQPLHRHLFTDRNNFRLHDGISGWLVEPAVLHAREAALKKQTQYFGVAGTPRISLAYYLKRPGGSGVLSGTRFTFDFTKGSKEPGVYYQNNSLYGLLSNTSIVPNGPQLIAQYHVRPFLAEQSRTYDGGVQQQLFGGKARLSSCLLSATNSQIKLNIAAIPGGFRVPEEIAQAQGIYGAAINTLNYRAQGAEVGLQYQVNHRITLRGGWTYTDAVVQQSFASSALLTRHQPAVSGYSDRRIFTAGGARPFRIAPNAGFVGVDCNHGRWFVSGVGTFVSRRDDSTFLVDTYFETLCCCRTATWILLSEDRSVCELSNRPAYIGIFLGAEPAEPGLSGGLRLSRIAAYSTRRDEVHVRWRILEAEMTRRLCRVCLQWTARYDRQK